MTAAAGVASAALLLVHSLILSALHHYHISLLSIFLAWRTTMSVNIGGDKRREARRRNEEKATKAENSVKTSGKMVRRGGGKRYAMTA